MSYTPINWQNGDTITAEKMNKMDNGWGVSSSELFSETVLTTAGGQGNSAELTYASTINADTIIVTFDSTDYECNKITFGESYFYGGFSTSPPGPDFTDYPFFVMSGEGNYLYTETAGTHTIAVNASAIECGANFVSAVNSVLEQMGVAPLELIEGVTLYDDADAAFDSGRLIFFNYNSQRFYVSTVGFGANGVKFVPDSNEITAGFSYDDLTFYLTYL